MRSEHCTEPRPSAATRRMAGCGARAISRAELRPDCAVTLIAGTEGWHTMASLTPGCRRAGSRSSGGGGWSRWPSRQSATGSAANSCSRPIAFIITPVGRVADIARAHAEGDEVRTVIAGYHWFTDWGRDTMISLEGLTLVTGRARGSQVDPAHLRRLRAGRADPEHVPGGRHRGALPHRRRDAVVLPRAGALSRALPGRDDLVACCCRSCATSCATTSRARKFGIRVDPRTAC